MGVTLAIKLSQLRFYLSLKDYIAKLVARKVVFNSVWHEGVNLILCIIVLCQFIQVIMWNLCSVPIPGYIKIMAIITLIL